MFSRCSFIVPPNKFKLELPSLYLRLHVLAPTWISSAPGCALLLSETLPSPLPLCLPSWRPHQAMGPPHQPLLGPGQAGLACHSKELSGESWCRRGLSTHIPKLGTTEWHPGSVASLGVLNKMLCLFQKDEHLSQINDFSKVGSKFWLITV